MNDADPESIVASMALSLAPADSDAFALAAMAAVEAMPPELRGPGSVHRAIEAEWLRFFRPTDGPTAEVLASRYRMRRRASLAG
jgi:hypothetical protein